MLSIEFGSDAKKFLKNAERETASRIIEKIEHLQTEPFPQGVKKVLGRKDKIYRIRVGDYRIQYTIIYE
jgi:mRNA interferase RelE/StbE